MKLANLKSVATTASAILFIGSLAVTEAGINQRQRRQQRRIYQGAKSGQLTGKEFNKLERGEAKIERDEFKARSDGNFTPKERAKINRELNHESRQIYKEKHDNQTATNPPLTINQRENRQ